MAGAFLALGLGAFSSLGVFLASGLALGAFRSLGAFLACGLALGLLMLLLLLAWPWAQLELLELLEGR